MRPFPVNDLSSRSDAGFLILLELAAENPLTEEFGRRILREARGRLYHMGRETILRERIEIFSAGSASYEQVLDNVVTVPELEALGWKQDRMDNWVRPASVMRPDIAGIARNSAA